MDNQRWTLTGKTALITGGTKGIGEAIALGEWLPIFSYASTCFILKTIDSLKLAELQNYFGNDCILTLVPHTCLMSLREDSIPQWIECNFVFTLGERLSL